MSTDRTPLRVASGHAKLPRERELGSGRVSHAETALLWRMARRVLSNGNPAGDNVLLAIARPCGKFPLLGITLTRAKRLICWPLLPARVCVPSEEGRLLLTDHVTLELRSSRSHSTTYEPGGERDHPRRWKLHQFPENGVSFWFGFAVRKSTIENQVLERHQWIRMPSPDTQRRIEEFRQFPAKLRFVDVNVPEFDEAGGNAVIALVYLVDGAPVRLSERLVDFLNEWSDEFWDARPDGRVLNVISTGFAVSGVQLGLLLGFPPSNLREAGPVLMTLRKAPTTGCSTR